MRRFSALKKLQEALFKSKKRDRQDSRQNPDDGVATGKTTPPHPTTPSPIDLQSKTGATTEKNDDPKVEPKPTERPPSHQDICPCDGSLSVLVDTPPTSQRQDSLPTYGDQAGQHLDLWTQAYREFETHQPELAADYSRHLIAFHQGDMSADVAAISDASARTYLSNLNSTEPLMEQLLQNRAKEQWRIPLLEKDVKFRDQVEKLTKFLLWSDQFVKTAMSTQPCAALAWSGVSILLPVGIDLNGFLK